MAPVQMGYGLHLRNWPISGFRTSLAGYGFLGLYSWRHRLRQLRAEPRAPALKAQGWGCG